MYLNSGVINKEISQKYRNVRYFLDSLVRAKNLAADIVINNKVIHGVATFNVDSGYVFASVNSLFSIKDAPAITSLRIDVYYADNPSEAIVSSYTDNLNEFIPSCDTDSDLYFYVGSVFPYNDLKFNLCESKFRSMRSSKIPSVEYDSLPDYIEMGEDLEGKAIGYYEKNGNTITVIATEPGSKGNDYMVAITGLSEDNGVNVAVVIYDSGLKAQLGTGVARDVEVKDGLINLDVLNNASLIDAVEDGATVNTYVTISGYASFDDINGADNNTATISLSGGEDLT